MRTLFESDEEDYYEAIRTSNAFNDNYIDYESNAYKDKMLSIEDYLDKIRPYLSRIINDQEKTGMENSIR